MAKYFEITNTLSGQHLDTYEAETPEEALDAMARDAGYADHASVPEECRADEGTLKVTEVFEVKIEERGNGFPDEGDYVQVDGELYRVVSVGSDIHTQSSDRGNFVLGYVHPSSKRVDDDDIFPCAVTITE